MNYRENQKLAAAQYDREKERRAFDEKFRPQIESGLTLEQFESTYQTTPAIIEMFKSLAADVQAEQESGRVFLAGFLSED